MWLIPPYDPCVVVSVVVEVHGVIRRGAVALGNKVLRQIDGLAVQDLLIGSVAVR